MVMGTDFTPASFASMDRPSSDNPVLRATIAASTANTTLVAATAGQRIRVLNFLLVVKTTAVDIKFQSTTGGTDLTGAMTPAAGTQLTPSYDPNGHIETKTGELLNLNQSGTSVIGGWLTYQLVDPLD